MHSRRGKYLINISSLTLSSTREICAIIIHREIPHLRRDKTTYRKIGYTPAGSFTSFYRRSTAASMPRRSDTFLYPP